MTVAQYEAEFVALSRYAPERVTPETHTVSKFERGLRSEIRHAMAGVRVDDFPSVVRRAHAIERSIQEAKMEQVAKTVVMGKTRGNNSKKRRWDSSSSNRTVKATACKTGGRWHRGQCKIAQGNVCYHCVQPGHMRKDYPRRSGVASSQGITCYRCGQPGHTSRVCRQPAPVEGQRTRGSDQKPAQKSTATRGRGAASRPAITDSPQVSSRVFALSAAEAEGGNETVQGREVVLDCEIVVCERVMPGDLVVLAIQNFDLLLGMNWLSRHYAKVDCRHKGITFEPPDQLEIMYRGVKPVVATPMILVMRAEKLIQQGCEAYLAFVTVTPGERKELADLPIVRDLSDVFSKELPSLPPYREIDFSIELLPGTQPISRTPYRMAANELKELKV
ncbi:uncharacterized protein LOC127811118 [Diospyros lotus]|uniref:uncharacterized protein LOC127811118 n=1 Tax=Diospyros lotus TaxID=55363 RepID=UPI00224FCE5E|nr:uncharacterized protein LOC127811118 [Diospyros lotus]